MVTHYLLGSASEHSDMTAGQLLLLLCILSTTCLVHTLEPAEEIALTEIFTNFPDLAHISRVRQFYYEYPVSGPAWTGNFANCVAGTSSWAYYGIHCDLNGNVDAIALYVNLIGDVTFF